MNYLSKKTLHRTLALTVGSVALVMVSMSGCKKSPLDGRRACDDLVKQSEAFRDALETFYEDMSVANCQKLKKIGEDYIKAARNCNWHPEMKQAAEEAMEQWGDFDCNEYAD